MSPDETDEFGRREFPGVKRVARREGQSVGRRQDQPALGSQHPTALGKEVTELLAIPTIGIGAGPDCSGQVLVMHDMLGINLGKNPKFVRNFMDGASSVREAMAAYVAAVKDGSFPDDSLHAW